MTNIALPIWLLIVLVGTPSVCLLGLAIRIKKKRTQIKACDQDRSSPQQAMTAMTENTFQHSLYALQIDAVFNALTALIETERIKLKSLLCPTLSQVPDLPIDRDLVDTQEEMPLKNQPKGISQQIADKAAAGQSSGEIAYTLGISRSEVELAMSITAAPEKAQPQGMEVVA